MILRTGMPFLKSGAKSVVWVWAIVEVSHIWSEVGVGTASRMSPNGIRGSSSNLGLNHTT